MDRLEEFIRNNREKLDRHAPSPATWRNIRKELHGKRIGRVIWIPVAAMIIILFATSALFYINRSYSFEHGFRRNSTLRIMKANPQLLETELYYNNIVNALYTEAGPLFSDYPDIEKELNHDLSMIDSLCTEIKKDLKDNIDNQDVIEALINNYRIKLRILEDMLEVLRQNENDETKTINHAL